MVMRRKESRAKRGRSFGRNALRTHKKNIAGNPMRGGIRL